MSSFISKLKKHSFSEIVKYGFSTMAKYTLVYSSYLLPVYKNCVFFRSYQGMYNDNPRAVSERLHKEYPEIPIYWAISAQGREPMPEYVHKVPFNSAKYWALIAYSQVTVESGFGMRLLYAKKGSIKAAFCKGFCKKRKRQLNISTWHGTPLKKIGLDFKNYWVEGEREKTIQFSCADYTLAGCTYSKEYFLRASGNKIPVKLYGTPRNDALFRKDIDITEIKKKLHLPLDKKIVLFAPTWRPYSLELSGIEQINTINMEELLKKLNEKFGGEYIFVFRFHPVVVQKINNAEYQKKYGNIIADGNFGDDMAEYLLCTDVLITDYSGSFFDFALTGRPCFLYAPDKELYEQGQGFYQEYEWYPFPKAYTPKELLECIEGFDENTYRKDMDEFLEKLGNKEDGHASERVVKDIIDFLRKNNTGK